MFRNNIGVQSTPKSSITTSKPINIPNKNMNRDEYSLKLNIIDPNKCSPPSSWNNRLINRINNYEINH